MTDPRKKLGTEPEFDWYAALGFITAIALSAIVAILAIVGLITIVS